MSNLFKTLFDIDNGYINIDSIMSLNNNKFIEKFNKNKLGYILNNINDIETLYRVDARNEVSLSKYYRKSDYEGFISTEYIQSNNGLYGRYQAKFALSGQGMIREARHTIFNDYYIDLDIDNCHPVITKWICNNLNIDCYYLTDYIINREKIIKELIKLNSNYDREYFKKVFLKISYGCSNNSYDKMVKNKNDFINNFRKEIINIQELISNKFYKFYEINKTLRDKKNKQYNYNGSCLSHICQFVENQLLMIIINFFHSKKINLQDSILCFDGLMINKNKFKLSYLDDLKFKFENMGININMSIKNMDLDKKILSLCDYDDNNNYEYIPLIKPKVLDSNDKYFYIDFINDLISKTWYEDELEDFIIENINRVMFYLIAQKNILYGRLNNDSIKEILLTGNIIKFINNDNEFKTITLKKLIENRYINYIHKYNDFCFIPYSNDDICSNYDNNNFNLYQGFRAKLLDSYNYDLIKPLLDHWFEVLANSNHINFKYQLSYFNRIFKYPSKKTKVIMVFKSSLQQIGKGIILNKLIGELIMGNSLYKVNTGLTFINKQFNARQCGTLLNICEELSNINDAWASTFDSLKTMSTEDIISIEQKGKEQYDINNYANYICNTNNNIPVKIEIGDARFALFECSGKYHKNFSYFNNLFKSINQETANHLYTYIYNLNDVVADLRNIPHNEFYNDVKFNSLHNSIRFLYSIKYLDLDDNYSYDSWQKLYVDSLDRDKMLIQSSLFNNVYKLWCIENKENATSMSRFKSYTSDCISIFYKNNVKFYNINSLNVDCLS